MTDTLGHSFGFNFVFFSLLFFVFVPMIATRLRIKMFQQYCDSWLKNNGYNYTQITPEPHLLSKGKLRWLVSDAQLVFSIKNCEKEEFWFACGSWLLGPITKQVKVYKVNEKDVLIIDKFKAS
ncbi:hypothetical protein FLL45_13625 [Aliikangiella marina]|uniref:Uncharacterized protein n=1 Tax=Aliikangiella marina TaxID=1712262 RepID=A0A545T9L6_9GAMM|nr:hypothetical protein [Aliikangiella marina]TQV73899.1 hypothetical protein FLL45_13625 [Aliikangiella marina]